MDAPIQIPEPIRQQLRLAMVDEVALVAALQRAEREAVTEPAGCLRSRPILTVRRPLDPEYAERRQIEVLLRPRGENLEVVAVHGLDLDGLAR